MEALAKHYVLGEVAHLTADVTLLATGVLTTPSNPRCKIRKPDGTLVDVVAQVSSAGKLYYDFQIGIADSDVGTYWYRFEGTGTAAGAGERAFVVDRSKVL